MMYLLGDTFPTLQQFYEEKNLAELKSPEKNHQK